MTWSKAGVTTGVFEQGTGQYGIVNAGVIDEWVAYLVTRGWVLDRAVAPEVPDTSSAMAWYWYLWKNVTFENGGVGRYGYRVKYDQKTGNDAMTVRAWDAGANRVYDNDIVNISMGKAISAQRFTGQWSFWESDEDGDSFFVMAADSSVPTVISFWPPSGSLYNSGASTTTGWSTGTLLLFDQAVLFIGINGTLVTAGSNSLLTSAYRNDTNGMTPQTIKVDFTIAGSGDPNVGMPLWRHFGGDVCQLTSIGESKGVELFGVSSDDNTTEVYYIDGVYYIGWGHDDKLLFDCGVNAPTF